jgi:hypothetical protein
MAKNTIKMGEGAGHNSLLKHMTCTELSDSWVSLNQNINKFKVFAILRVYALQGILHVLSHVSNNCYHFLWLIALPPAGSVSWLVNNSLHFHELILLVSGNELTGCCTISDCTIYYLLKFKSLVR